MQILKHLIRELRRFFYTIYKRRSAIYELAKRNFEAQFKNTYLGTLWAYIQPLIFVMLLVLVFTIGLRTNPAGNIPFVVFLLCGMIPWQFFAGLFPSLTSVIRAHAFLVRKGDFELSLLHIALMLGALIPHAILLAIMMAVNIFSHIAPTWYYAQLLYYLFAMCVLLLGLGWITSATSIFIDDVTNIVAIIIQFGFWFTPIIYNISIIPSRFRWLIKINPLCYIITGYRDSLIYGVPFWSRPRETLYYWLFTTASLLIGAVVFRKLKPHLGEVI